MLLVIDVGNTNTVLGIYRGEKLLAHWRIQTLEERTADEYAVLLAELTRLARLSVAPLDPAGKDRIEACMISTVVPPTLTALEALCSRTLGVTPLVVGPGTRTGMPILYENPREVGADRIVNAVAAFDQLKAGCVVVDFGTATTFDVVTPKGEYLGGAIAPGLGISADALYHHAAKLPRVELMRPARVVGRNTVASMQSGLIFGYAGLVDAIVERMRAELDFPAHCLATGGLAPLIAKESRTIESADEMLTLRGLKIIYERNAAQTPTAK